MLTTPHALVGLAIIQKSPNILGLFLALISHFIFDFFLPHWNPHLYTELKKTGKISFNSILVIIIDGLLAVGLTLFFMSKSLPNLNQALFYGLGPLMAVLPDLIEIPYYFLNYKANWLKKYVYFEHKYQANTNFLWGTLTQVLVVIASLKILFFK